MNEEMLEPSSEARIAKLPCRDARDAQHQRHGDANASIAETNQTNNNATVSLDLGSAPIDMGNLVLPMLGILSIVVLAAGAIACTRARKRRKQRRPSLLFPTGQCSLRGRWGMIKVEDVIGSEVLSADAKVVGTIEGIGIDTEGWKGKILKVQVTKGLEETLGVKKPLFGAARFYFDVQYVDSIAHVITVSRKADKMKEIGVDSAQVQKMAGDILLKMIVTSNGEQIGTVSELYFDEKRNWSMPYLQAKMTKELRKAWKERKLKAGLIKIPTIQVRTVGDVVMLDVTTAQLKDILEHSPG